MAQAQPPKKQDPARAISDELRGRHGIESRAGVEDTERVDYFRGKDFAAFFKEHPEKILAGMSRSGASQDESIRDMMHLLIRRGLARRTDRFYKKPKPGRKRLTKWPRKLQPLPPHEQRWTEDSFYAWTYDLPTSPWLLIGSIGLAATVLLLCLFPLAPYKLKILVVYASLGLVGLLLGTIVLRWVVAGATWFAAGRALWLLPNMLSETVGLDEAFLPLWELEEVGEGWAWWRSHLWQRAVFAASVAALLWALSRVAPGTGELTSGAKATHDQLLEWLNLQDAQFGRLAGSNDTAGGNATAAATAAPKPAQMEQRSAAAAVAAAKAAAAAQPGKTPGSDRVPSFEELQRELDVQEAGDEAADRARAAGSSEEAVQQARDAAAAAVRQRHAEQAAADRQQPPEPDEPPPRPATDEL